MAEKETATSDSEHSDHKEEEEQTFEDATSPPDEVTPKNPSPSSDNDVASDDASEGNSTVDVQTTDGDNTKLKKIKTNESAASEKRLSKESAPSTEPHSSPEVESKRSSKSSDPETASNNGADGSISPQRSSRSASIENSDLTPKPAPTKTTRFGAFSASLPAVPWGGTSNTKRPPSTTRDPSPQPPAQPTLPRRNTPFGWLSRATSTSTTKSPPALPPRASADARRSAAASISTLGSNPELMLKALEETQDGRNGDKGPARQSLKEKFKQLRLQDEANATSNEADHSAESTIISPADSTSTSREYETLLPHSSTPSSPIVNSELPPGTVSGFLAANMATPINWDFWQSVVNEGPQAVARTSPEELTMAIAGGIPHTIRGVIWQVLASSKNEDLEAVYHDLRLRGTKDEIKDDTTASISSTANGSIKGKESINSSRSSVHSENSTPAISAHSAVASPTASSDVQDPLNNTKAQTQIPENQLKWKKTDPVAISKLEKIIKRDMGSRTSYSKYTTAAGFQDGLFNVCKAYALFDDAVGYPQGMNFVIMPMLFNMSEEEAFCLLVRLMHKYQLREMFVQDMPGLHLHLYQFERLLEDLEPALYYHLNRRGVAPNLYATQWFLTLFAYRLPLQLVMRVFDLVLCEGLEGAILKFGMALIQRNVEVLLAMNDMQALTTYMKEKLFDAYVDQAPTSKSIMESGFFGNSGGTDTDIYRADILVQDACAVKLTPEMLAKYTAEYEEKSKTEKARETELENLRSDTSTKAAQIRSLEQRAEKSDAEHIQLANELVRLKVENHDLMDENESLKGQVEELRKVAASEAANVEKRLQASMEQVMQKNIEVQNQNRHMEEQLTDMERELVAMKLKHAEITGEHEGLKQRWSDLKRALG